MITTAGLQGVVERPAVELATSVPGVPFGPGLWKSWPIVLRGPDHVRHFSGVVKPSKGWAMRVMLAKAGSPVRPFIRSAKAAGAYGVDLAVRATTVLEKRSGSCSHGPA